MEGVFILGGEGVCRYQPKLNRGGGGGGYLPEPSKTGPNGWEGRVWGDNQGRGEGFERSGAGEQRGWW